MSKRVTTQWYMGAWSVAALAVIADGAMARTLPTGTPPPWFTPILAFTLVVSGALMLVMWIGALVQLGQQQAWGWFAAVLLLHLNFLGVVGMIAYAIAGPEDAGPVVIRPTTT